MLINAFTNSLNVLSRVLMRFSLDVIQSDSEDVPLEVLLGVSLGKIRFEMLHQNERRQKLAEILE